MDKETLKQIKQDLAPIIAKEEEFLGNYFYSLDDWMDKEEAWNDCYEQVALKEFKEANRELYNKYPKIFTACVPTKELLDNLNYVVIEYPDTTSSLENLRALISRLEEIKSLLEIWE